MPVDDERYDRGGQPPDSPGTVYSADRVWSLEAAPASVEVAANEMRSLGTKASTARDTVDSSARMVDGEGSWEGDTADA